MTSLFLCLMDNKLLKQAFALRFEYYNFYENKEDKWHEKYKNHKLYNVVVKSFKYDFKQIAMQMPKLILQENIKED